MNRRWALVLVAVLALADLVVLGMGYRARSGSLPPWQVKDPVFSVSPSPSSDVTDGATPTAADGVTAPLLLAVNDQGLVLRATRGACQAEYDKTAQVAVGTIGTDTEPQAVTVDGLKEALGLMVYPDGSMRIAGRDDQCHQMVYTSSDRGRTWSAASSTRPGIWALDADTTAETVSGPLGASPALFCVPVQVVNLAGRQGLASCRSDAFYELAQRQSPIQVDAAGYTQLSVARAAGSSFYLFGGTSDCAAQVAELDAAKSSIKLLKCFGADAAPLAIGVAGDRLVVQLGEQIQVSTDGGQSFGPMA